MSLYDQFRALADDMQAGVITVAEFEVLKADLMRRPMAATPGTTIALGGGGNDNADGGNGGGVGQGAADTPAVGGSAAAGGTTATAGGDTTTAAAPRTPLAIANISPGPLFIQRMSSPRVQGCILDWGPRAQAC